MSIKHIEAGRKGGRPHFSMFPPGTPGANNKGGLPTVGVGMFPKLSHTRSVNLKEIARGSLLLIIMPE